MRIKMTLVCLVSLGLASCGDTNVKADGSGSGDTTTVSTTGTSDPSTSAGSGTGNDSEDAADCDGEVFSDLPGVSLAVSTDACEYTLAEAQAGVLTERVLTIEEALENVDSGTDCYDTPMGSVYVSWRVFAEGHLHCVCDVGLCAGPTPMPTTLVPGSANDDFTWHGYDWNGPSDYGQEFGPAFPPGDYTIEVRAQGTWGDGTGESTPFEVWARRVVKLVP